MLLLVLVLLREEGIILPDRLFYQLAFGEQDEQEGGGGTGRPATFLMKTLLAFVFVPPFFFFSGSFVFSLTLFCLNYKCAQGAALQCSARSILASRENGPQTGLINNTLRGSYLIRRRPVASPPDADFNGLL